MQGNLLSCALGPAVDMGARRILEVTIYATEVKMTSCLNQLISASKDTSVGVK